MLGQRRRLRRLAAEMLVVWLLALTAGIVNGCVVAPELRHAALSADHHAALPASTAGHHGTDGSADPGHPAPGDAHSPCVKFCGDESTSLPTQKQQSATWTGLWLAPPPSPLVAIAAQEPGACAARPDALLRRERVPIPIALLRLTL